MYNTITTYYLYILLVIQTSVIYFYIYYYCNYLYYYKYYYYNYYQQNTLTNTIYPTPLPLLHTLQTTAQRHQAPEHTRPLSPSRGRRHHPYENNHEQSTRMEYSQR